MPALRKNSLGIGSAVAEPSEAYFREVAQHTLLRADEEIALAQQMEDGKNADAALKAEPSTLSVEDRAEIERLVELGNLAHQRMIECNLRLVLSVARHYVGRGLSLMDLVQEGNIGLQHGVERYDWRRGFRLSTYAHWWIRQGIVKSLHEQGRSIRLPSDVSTLVGEANRIEQRLIEDLGRQPTLDEIADELGGDPTRLAAARQAGRPVLLFGMPATNRDDDDRSVGDSLVDEQAELAGPIAAESDDLSQRLGSIVDELDPYERRVLRLRFGLGDELERSHAEAADEMKISVLKVRQLEAQALGRLRKMPRLRRELAEYVHGELNAAA